MSKVRLFRADHAGMLGYVGRRSQRPGYSLKVTKNLHTLFSDGGYQVTAVRGTVGGLWGTKEHRARALADAWSRDLASALPAAVR